MAGHDSAADAAAEAKLKGLNKYFNGVTLRGRANVSQFNYYFQNDFQEP